MRVILSHFSNMSNTHLSWFTSVLVLYCKITPRRSLTQLLDGDVIAGVISVLSMQIVHTDVSQQAMWQAESRTACRVIHQRHWDTALYTGRTGACSQSGLISSFTAKEEWDHCDLVKNLQLSYTLNFMFFSGKHKESVKEEATTTTTAHTPQLIDKE